MSEEQKPKGFSFSSIATDADAEVDGVWFDYYGCKLRIARWNNRRYTDYMQKLTKPYREQIRSETLPNEIAEKLEIKAISRTILVGWEDVLDDQGNQLAFSPDEAEKQMLEIHDLYEDVKRFASSSARYRKSELEGAEKN